MLKQKIIVSSADYETVAFGRLCVETFIKLLKIKKPPAVAFGRLCVETRNTLVVGGQEGQSPSGGCVLKQVWDARV